MTHPYRGSFKVLIWRYSMFLLRLYRCLAMIPLMSLSVKKCCLRSVTSRLFFNFIIIISLFIQQQNSTNTVTNVNTMELKREWQGCVGACRWICPIQKNVSLSTTDKPRNILNTSTRSARSLHLVWSRIIWKELRQSVNAGVTHSNTATQMCKRRGCRPILCGQYSNRWRSMTVLPPIPNYFSWLLQIPSTHFVHSYLRNLPSPTTWDHVLTIWHDQTNTVLLTVVILLLGCCMPNVIDFYCATVIFILLVMSAVVVMLWYVYT